MSSKQKKKEAFRTLEACREQIDMIDRQILSLLFKRQDIAAEIGKEKDRLGMEVWSPSREREVLQRLSSENSGNLSSEAIRHIFSEIISASRAVQSPMRVAYLGPEATFCHQAAHDLFGHSVSLAPAESVPDVFRLVETGACHRGVVPIENSSAGSVDGTLDLLYTYDLKIRAEYFLRIRNNLLSTAKRIDQVERVYSHPMPIAQCRAWLRSRLPRAELREMPSTALAAKAALQEPHAAVVGSRMVARIYGLNLLEEHIEDDPSNSTRFLVMGKTCASPGEKNKTSLLLSVSHRPGSLHGVLEPLTRRHINMTRLESRPMKSKKWEYMFYVDLEGHEQDANMSEALKEVEERCMFLKRLGSYPAGGHPWD